MAAQQESANFSALDACHQQTLVHLDHLAALMLHVQSEGLDDAIRQQAGAIEQFFSTTSRSHHAEEDKTIFGPLLANANEELQATIRGLQQDHGWIEENWIELAPQLRAIASGNSWLDTAEFLHYAEVFVDLCRDHVAREESVIYPQSKAQWAAYLAARPSRKI